MSSKSTQLGRVPDQQSETQGRLSLGQCAAMACLIEATAPKPGNVHRGADFEDVTYPDFLVSAIAIGPAMDRAETAAVGKTVLDCVAATRQWVRTNTNLGMVLLFAPLAKVPRSRPLRTGVREVLTELTPADARDVYEAIRIAQPGGLGEVSEADVNRTAPDDLLTAMRLAADRDLVARQYVDGFHHVLEIVVPWLTDAIRVKRWPVADAVVHTFLRLLATEPDSLIARKCGAEIAKNASLRSARVLETGEPGSLRYQEAIHDFDFWLRSDHHRRNPGTTADLIAAGLFALLRDGIIEGPLDLAMQTEIAEE